MLALQGNLAGTYAKVGRQQQALQMERDVYSSHLKRFGEEDRITIRSASNYAASLIMEKRFKEAKSLLRRTIPIARRVLGEGNEVSLGMRSNYGRVLCQCRDATLDDLREAVTTLEETERTARRVLGCAHPLVERTWEFLRSSRTILDASDRASTAREK